MARSRTFSNLLGVVLVVAPREAILSLNDVLRDPIQSELDELINGYARSMPCQVRKPIPLVLIFLLMLGSADAQQPASPTKTASKVKAKVETLASQAHISVIPMQGEEEFGAFVSKDVDGFTFYDIDRKTEVGFRYEDVRKVKDCYGGYNHLRRKHTDRTKTLVASAVVVGGLVALIVAVALARD